MYSLAFPNMFNSASTKLYQDHQATYTNLVLLIMSELKSLFGDPGFGTGVKQLIYEQNNAVLRDIATDKLYVAIQTFMPQILIKRSDIEMISDGTTLTIYISCINLLDMQPDTYSIQLMS